jgi:hypothetical protein
MTARAFSFEINRASTAPPEVLFRLETDAPCWARWGRPLIVQAGWAREAEEPGGVGAIRKLGLWPVLISEKTLVYERNRHHVYTFAGRAPVRDYRAEVTFTPNGSGGTDLCWRGSFTERVPGTGPLAQALLRSVVAVLAARLARGAEREPATC